MKVIIEFTVSESDGYLVTQDGYRLAYGGVPSHWIVKPEDFEHIEATE